MFKLQITPYFVIELVDLFSMYLKIPFLGEAFISKGNSTFNKKYNGADNHE